MKSVLRALLPKVWSALTKFERPGRTRPCHYLPFLEQLETRNLLSTLLQLDNAGAGFATGALTAPFSADVYDFKATVTGKMSVLMRAEVAAMQSQLTVDVPATDSAFLASQDYKFSRDHVVQFDVVAGQDYEISAGLPTSAFSFFGSYQLYLSTEAHDFSGTTPQAIALDSSGLGIQLGTLERAGDTDFFFFTTSVTGRVFISVDGGTLASQELYFDITPGNTFGVKVFDPAGHTGVYVLTINAIRDDFPDVQTFPVVLDASGSASLAGRINYSDDVDVFRFTATKTGTMTLKMLAGADTELVSQLTVAPALVSYAVSPSHLSFLDASAVDRIVQFQVVKGQQYVVRAAGAGGSIGDYTLYFSMPVDDFSASTPRFITLDSSGAGTQSGSIEVPNDVDRFAFTAQVDGYVIVAMNPAEGTFLQGSLSFPVMPAVVATQSDPNFNRLDGPGWVYNQLDASGDGIIFQTFSSVGWLLKSRGAFIGIAVKAGQSYEFLVSGENSIGTYSLALSSYAGFDSSGEPFGQPVTFINRGLLRNDAGTIFHFERSLTFLLFDPPGIYVEETAFAPLLDIQKGPAATNTRLAAFALSGANPGAAPSPSVTVPGTPSTGVPASSPPGVTGSPSVSAASNGAATNSLINTLLVVSARDNSTSTVQDSTTVVTANFAPGLLSALLIGGLSPGQVGAASAEATGDEDVNAVTARVGSRIAGTVFEDVDGNGRQGDGEAGVAGEKMVLERQDESGQYVVVATTLTDASGAYAFPEVPEGKYRVRRNAAGAEADLTTPDSYSIQVERRAKPGVFNFGKVSSQGQSRVSRDEDLPGWAVDMILDDPDPDDLPWPQEWSEATPGGALLDDDGAQHEAAMDGWLCLLPLTMWSFGGGTHFHWRLSQCSVRRPLDRPRTRRAKGVANQETL